jgi:hypothetical protein
MQSLITRVTFFAPPHIGIQAEIDTFATSVALPTHLLFELLS